MTGRASAFKHTQPKLSAAPWVLRGRHVALPRRRPQLQYHGHLSDRPCASICEQMIDSLDAQTGDSRLIPAL